MLKINDASVTQLVQFFINVSASIHYALDALRICLFCGLREIQFVKNLIIPKLFVNCDELGIQLIRTLIIYFRNIKSNLRLHTMCRVQLFIDEFVFE